MTLYSVIALVGKCASNLPTPTYIFLGKNASVVPVTIGVVSLAGTLDTTLDGEVTFTLHAMKVAEREIFMGKRIFF